MYHSPLCSPKSPRVPLLSEVLRAHSRLKLSHSRQVAFVWTFLSHNPSQDHYLGVTIDLSDDVLLEIFKFFTEIFRPNYVGKDAWHMLVHVCRRWRHIVFASPHYLNLRLHCTNRTPVRKMLDVWPAFPIVVMCHNENSSSPLQGVLDVIAALKSYDRVCEIDLSGIPYSLLKRFAALTIPFPELTSLRLHSDEEWPLILPDSFLGGFAPRLRSLRLNGIPFPAPQKLFLSCTRLATLRMEDIPDTGYILPEKMAACLSALTNVEEVTVGFRCSQVPWDETRRDLPLLLTRAVLPSLTYFGFRGHSWYLEDLISQIDVTVPLLDNFDITFFFRTLSATPLFCKLISRMETFKGFHRAKVTFQDHVADITLSRQERSADCKTSKLGILCRRPDLPLYMARICSLSLPPLSTLKHLYIGDSCWLTRLPDEMDNLQCLELLLPFTSVENLYLSHKQALYVTRALQSLTCERIVQVLPALQAIFLQRSPVLGADPEVPGQFIAARQLIGRSVYVHYYSNVVKTECLHGVSSRGGPGSETGSRSRRERERVREGAVVKSGRRRSEAAGTRAKGDKLFDSGLHWHPPPTRYGA